MSNELVYIDELVNKAKETTKKIRTLHSVKKNKILNSLAEELIHSKEIILHENAKDLEEAKKRNLKESLVDRLLLNQKRIESLAASVVEIANLPDPIGEVVRGLTLTNGAELVTKRVPLGVVLVIYESRPNVTIDVSALCFKSGNISILRGGSEAFHSNQCLVNIFKKVLIAHEVSENAVLFMEKTDRALMVPILKKKEQIDIVVPRGGESLIEFVVQNSLIPVIKHDKGVCNIFIDESADFHKILPIILNSKIQRPGVCNAVENLIIHKNFSKTRELLHELAEHGVFLLLDENLAEYKPDAILATEDDFATEFLDLRLSIKKVDSLDDAILFIEKFSSGHTEAILSNDKKNIDRFVQQIDSAAVFVNCSTRFHDGGQFGLGAEVGISTGKLHVRGPMGLVHLTTTKTILNGDWNIRET